jgi:CRP-like cAMP-binding protein
MALLLDEPRHANVTAVGDVEVYALNKVTIIIYRDR